MSMSLWVYRSLIFALALFLTVGALSSESQSEQASIAMKEKAVITGRAIFLGDIASIESSDESLLSALKKIEICSAAEPGFSQTLHAGYIKSRMRQQGIVPESIKWGDCQRAQVETKAQHLSSKELLSYAEKFIKSRRLKNSADAVSSIQVRPMNDMRPAVLPCGKVDVKVQLASFSGQPAVNGIVPLRFAISVDGKECERRTVLFRIEALKEVLVATRLLEMHRIIEADDMQPALRDIGMSTSVFSQKGSLIGMRTKRFIPAGGIIVGDMVEVPPIIEQGDVVKIIIESPVFRITAQGKARQAGARGSVIRVMNTVSMKEITARIVDEKSVRVAF